MSGGFEGQLDARVGMGGGMVGTAVDPRGMQQSQANTINKPPRLESSAIRLEHLVGQLEKKLVGAHMHLDRIVGAGPPRDGYAPNPPTAGNGSLAGAVPQVVRIENALDRLAGLTDAQVGSVLSRLSQL